MREKFFQKCYLFSGLLRAAGPQVGRQAAGGVGVADAWGVFQVGLQLLLQAADVLEDLGVEMHSADLFSDAVNDSNAYFEFFSKFCIQNSEFLD